MSHKGSCLCGGISFEIDGDFDSFFLCHCQRCRKDTGSAHAANLFSSTARLRWLSGQDRAKTFRLGSTRHARSFCSDCGSALPGLQMDGSLLVVPAGCLDSAVPISPQGHIYFGSRA
ncbi:MAG: GFA family protein, partial [Gammaproteobacteria bacterium]|nr:GFA family protein [Gammaproteobacteria bacterium]